MDCFRILTSTQLNISSHSSTQLTSSFLTKDLICSNSIFSFICKLRLYVNTSYNINSRTALAATTSSKFKNAVNNLSKCGHCSNIGLISIHTFKIQKR